jgi:hypothetical protein
VLARLYLSYVDTIHPATHKEVVSVETLVRFQAFASVETWGLDEEVIDIGIFNVWPLIPVK